MKLFLTIHTIILFCPNGDGNPAPGSPYLIEKDASLTDCPTGYTRPANLNSNSCYKNIDIKTVVTIFSVYTTYKTRKDAADQCQLYNGTLATVANSFINSHIHALASQAGATSLWLGIQCSDKNPSNCINDDTTNFTYNNFAPGQPTTEDVCIFMTAVGKRSKTWTSFECQQRFQFVCEAPAGVYEPVISCTTEPTPTGTPTKKKRCPLGYTEFQGVCYTLMVNNNFGLSRDEQSAYCKRIPGGNLATIASEEVNRFMNSLCGKATVRIGLRWPFPPSKGNTSTCEWDDGTQFSYSSFAPGYPRLFMDGCLYTDFGDWSNDYGCNSPFAYSACQAPMQ